jgi:hypothetical protein
MNGLISLLYTMVMGCVYKKIVYRMHQMMLKHLFFHLFLYFNSNNRNQNCKISV